MSASNRELGFDPDALREKYRLERDRRVRVDGNDQYIEVKGDFANYIDDPYVAKPVAREPLTDLVDVLIVGGGFGGLLSAARLADAGVVDVRIIEKGGDFGGTWYWNRYPGAQCDIEAYIYLPLLEEVGYMPSQKYVYAPEILQHASAIGQKYGLYDKACFQTEVTDLTWNEADRTWLATTNRGDSMRAKFVVMSNGPLNRPKLPGITGIDEFQGHTFHTSRWDYDYTGGDSTGGLRKLADKRVGIIGTGATAVQCVPHVGEWAKSLHVFQRTPSSIDVRGNKPTDPDWAKGLEAGWQKHRMENFNALVSGGIAPEDLVNDGWTDIIRNLLILVQEDSQQELTLDAMMAKMEVADFQKMNQIRARADALVNDEATAQALKPWYRQFCKRPCFHDDYLATFNRPNVTLVDTQGQGVDRVTPTGIVANGEAIELDCIIFATGFEVGTEYTRRSGYDLQGREDLRLSAKWASGVRTLHGLQTRGFPNCFFLGNTQTGFTVNFPHMLEEQSQHVAHIIRHTTAHNYGAVEVTPAGEQAWVDTIIAKATMAMQFFEDCTPGYYNNEGRPGERSGQNANYGGGPVEFFQLLADWRAKGDFDGLEFR